MKTAAIKKLTKAVGGWLSYQTLCGRYSLFSEGYISQPIAEFLLHRHSGKLVLEHPHPTLNKKGIGRPRQVDYVLLSKNRRNVTAALEVKWISNNACDKQAILNDLLRLEYFKTGGQYVHRYFLVAGRAKYFNKCFADLKIKKENGTKLNFTKHYLSFSSAYPEKQVHCRNDHEVFDRFYKRFIEIYKEEIPNVFCTELISRSNVDGIAVCMWKITSNKHRTTFDYY